MRPVRAALDANVLASGLAHAAGAPGQVVSAWWKGEFQLVTSEAIIEEVTRTLTKPYFVRMVSRSRHEAAMRGLRRQASRVTPAADIEGIATHPEDDLVLATAVAGQADFLVTGDNQLLKLGMYHGVRIVDVHDFIGRLQGKGPDEQ